MSSTHPLAAAYPIGLWRREREFFDADEAPRNYMMAFAIIYSLPPIAILHALRRHMVTGLTMGGATGWRAALARR